MSRIYFFSLFIFALISPKINAQCSGSLPFSDTITCGNNNIYTPSSFTSFNVGTTVLTIAANIQITDLCTATAPLSILALTITPGGGTPKKIIDFQFATGTGWNTLVEDTAGIKSMTAQQPSGTPVAGSWLTYFGTVDLRGTSASSAIIVPGFTNWGGVYANGLSFGNTWTFDSSTRIYICSSTTGTNSASCYVKSLDFWYTYEGTGMKSAYLWGLQPILLGNYRFQSQSGNAVIDTAGRIGAAYFGASTSTSVDTTNSPTWVGTEPGITFTTANQYVRIPTFTLKPSYGLSTQSITLNFWIKPTSLTAGFIFRYSTAGMASNLFSISLTNTGLITVQIGTGSKTTTTALSTGTWTQVTVSFVIQTLRPNANLLTIHLNGVSNVLEYALTVGTITWTPATDVVRIGGPTSFLGSLKELSIYSPGSLQVNSPSYCSTSTISCARDIGKTTPPTCISCPTGTTLYNSICLSCPAGQYLSTTNDCVDCPDNCQTCTSPTSCQSCKEGFTFYNSECVACTGTSQYVDEGTCVDCPSTCATCTSSSSCRTCNPGYALYKNQCITCPSGTYFSAQTCKTCPSTCVTCTSGTECQKCMSGYILKGTTCEAESGPPEQKKNPILIYASASLSLALIICTLTAILMNCSFSSKSSTNVAEIASPQKEDDVSNLIQIKPSDNTIMDHSSQMRLRDVVNKRKLRNQKDLGGIDLAYENNSPGLDHSGFS